MIKLSSANDARNTAQVEALTLLDRHGISTIISYHLNPTAFRKARVTAMLATWLG